MYQTPNLRQDTAKLYAPPETVHPTIRVRQDLQRARETKNPLTGFGVVTGNEAELLTLGEFDIAYLSGWREAAKHPLPDRSLYGSQDSVPWALAIQDAINRTRHYFFHHSGKVLRSPFLMVDVEAGFGDKEQVYNLAYLLSSQTETVIIHLENQHPFLKACGHQIGYENVGGKKMKEPKLIIPRDQFIKKLIASQDAAYVGAKDSHKPETPLTLARSDSPDGILEDGTRTTLQDAIDDLIAAHEEAGVLIGWAEFNNTEMRDPLTLAEKVLKRCPDMYGLFFNVSPNKYTEQHPVRSKPLAEAGYVGQFSTIPLHVIIQREMARFNREFRNEPFEAVIKIFDRAREQGMFEEYDGFLKGQSSVGTDWWRTLRQNLDDMLINNVK